MYDPWFRKKFTLTEKPYKATLFVASIGFHEVYVNGKKIDDHVLPPAVTDHTKRARYIAYEIAPELIDRKSTRLNSSHVRISYAVFCLKKKKNKKIKQTLYKKQN